MDYLKIIGRSFIYVISIILVSTIIITLLNYINILNSTFTTIFKILIPITSMFIGGFIIGKKTKNKGWLEGLKFGIIMIFILFLLNLIIFKQNFEFRNLLYYVILIASTIFGSMIGINKKVEKN